MHGAQYMVHEAAMPPSTPNCDRLTTSLCQCIWWPSYYYKQQSSVVEAHACGIIVYIIMCSIQTVDNNKITVLLSSWHQFACITTCPIVSLSLVCMQPYCVMHCHNNNIIIVLLSFYMLVHGLTVPQSKHAKWQQNGTTVILRMSYCLIVISSRHMYIVSLLYCFIVILHVSV